MNATTIKHIEYQRSIRSMCLCFALSGCRIECGATGTCCTYGKPAIPPATKMPFECVHLTPNEASFWHESIATSPPAFCFCHSKFAAHFVVDVGLRFDNERRTYTVNKLYLRFVTLLARSIYRNLT